jgi:hypothetical protein
MGLFSKLFKPSTAKIVETASGSFTLIYSKGSRNTWSNQSPDVLITLGGSALEPDPAKLSFSSTITHTVAKMNDQLTLYLSNQFDEAGLEHDFSEWQQRFKMVALEVTGKTGEKIYWNITLEDLRAPYAHFVLFVAEQTIIDFSMDM